MNREQRKEILEAIGIVAIVASLLFLAMEVRQANLATRISARDLATQGIIDQMGDIIDPQVLAVAYMKGWGDESLTDLESSQLKLYELRRWWNFERIFYLYRDDVISEQEWNGFRNAIYVSLSNPRRKAAQNAWATARRFMSEEFVEYVETEVLPAE